MSPEDNQNISPKPNSKQNKSAMPLIAGVLLLLLIAGGVYMFVSKKDDKKPANTATNQTTQSTVSKTAELTTDPSSATVPNNQVVTFAVYVDTGGQTVNAVQANLNYPTDKFDFVSIDSTGSAFSIQAESTGKDGKISIARAQVGGVTGKQLIAKVNLKAKTTSGDGQITFADDSHVISASTDNPDILNTTSGAKFVLGE